MNLINQNIQILVQNTQNVMSIDKCLGILFEVAVWKKNIERNFNEHFHLTSTLPTSDTNVAPPSNTI